LLSAASAISSASLVASPKDLPCPRRRLLGDLVELGLGALDLLERRDFLAGVERAFDQVAADADQRCAAARGRRSAAAKSRAPMIAAPEPVSCAR
jgi:hypothetical protein